MVEIGKIKIKKKIYKFELKKRYQHLRHYKAKERPPIERIKDQLRKLFAPPKKPERKRKAAPPPPGGFNFAVFGAAILIAVIILGMGWLYLSTQILQVEAGVFQPQLEKPAIENTVIGGSILSSGRRGEPMYTAAVSVDYDTENLKNYTIRLTPYEEKIPSEVFVLNSERFEASTYSDFVRVLRSRLSKRKIMLNEINVKQLETLPEGAMIIVPSGVIPKELLGFDSSLTMERLSERGIVIIYIGQPFTKMLNGTLVVTTPQDTVKALPFTFDETTPLQTSGNFSLFQPLYRVVGRTGWMTSLAYGSVTVAKKGDSAFIFLPQTLDGGWRSDYAAAAEDISTIVFDIPWAQPSGSTKVYEFANETGYSGTRHFFSESFEAPAATIKVEFIGYSPASNFPIQETLYTQLEKKVNSELFIEGGSKVVPTNITTNLVRMNAQLKEPTAAQPSMFLVMTDVNGTDVETFPQGNVNVQADRSFDVPIYVERGEYIVKLIDDIDRLYAQTYMKVVSIDILYRGYSPQKKSLYTFDVAMDGNPVNLGEVTLEIDGGSYGSYDFQDVSTIKVDVGQYTGGENLPEGQHTFEFTSGGLKVMVPVEHFRPRTIFDDPLFWAVVILTAGIVGVGIIFARQESVYYSVDIPDFPPVARTKIPLSPDVVLSIFEKVNDNYRWESTPLSPFEIKNGFKDIFYKGRSIYITDYNVEYLLDELEKKGKVKESLGYYGLATWEGRSKHSMDYLAMMRRLRDICVNNAIPFTGMGESKEADSVITVVGQQMFLHFFDRTTDPKGIVGKVLSTIGTGITIVVFKNETDKDSFSLLVDSSPSAAPLILKMESESKALLLLTADELEQMLIEFKAM